MKFWIMVRKWEVLTEKGGRWRNFGMLWRKLVWVICDVSGNGIHANEATVQKHVLGNVLIFSSYFALVSNFFGSLY